MCRYVKTRQRKSKVKYFDILLPYNFLSECVEPKDCPNGGTNYKCNANLCECPSPLFLDNGNCVGML